MTKAIGIDLGTTNSVLSTLSSSPPYHPKVIPCPKTNSPTTPSIVNIKFDKTGKEIVNVGKEAGKLLEQEPLNTIGSVKRFMGTIYKDLKFKNSLLAEDQKTGKTLLRIGGRTYTPEEVSSKILLKLKSYTPSEFWNDSSVVITVPAYFDEAQRRATKEAGRLAGLNVTRVINEPTAAALAYGIGNSKEGIIGVYDLGGGTFDVTILRVGGGVYEVLSTGGDSKLGGDDVDDILIKRICEKILSLKNTKNFNIDTKKNSLIDNDSNDNNSLIDKECNNKSLISKDINSVDEMYKNIRNSPKYQILKKIAENSKIKLSKTCSDTIKIPKNIFSKTEHSIKLKKEDLNKSIKPIFDRTAQICKKALLDSNITKDQLNEVILVGGMTKMPFIRKSVENLFNKKPLTSIDPDEAVAKGAAIQSGIISNIIKDSVLLDVNSLSLGIETLGGVFSTIIKRNSPLPVRKTQTFTTSEDDQKTVDINVYQGERPLVKYNSFLGKLKLQSIESMKKGMPRIDVTFEADVDGMIKVYAKDKATDQERRIDVVSERNSEVIENNIKEADRNRVFDEKEKLEQEKKFSK